MKYTYPGAIHIHSKYSDGTENIDYIAAKAKKAGLAWIIITDHNNLTGYSKNEEGWYDGVAVLIGEEISPESSDHYLALGIQNEISEKSKPIDFMNQVRAQGGLGFIAHPDENLCRKNKYRALRWTDWNVDCADGLEIWNYMSDWADNMKNETIFLDYARRHKILSGPSGNLLNWWDDLNNKNERIFPGIGGIDAHTFIHNLFGIKLKLFSYEDCFKTVTNYLYLEKDLSADFEEAKKQILSALKNGQNTIINKANSPKNSGFKCYITDGNKIVSPGNTINNDKNIKIIINIQKKCIIKLIHNGKLIKQINDSQLIYSDLTTGKYRIEIYSNGKPWIFTNPFAVN